MFSTYSVPGINIILTKTPLWDWYCYPHFIGEETEKLGNLLKVTQLVGSGGSIEPRMFGCLARFCSGTGMKKAFLLPGQISSLGFLPHPCVLFLFYLWRSVGWFSCPWVTNPPEEAWPLFQGLCKAFCRLSSRRIGRCLPGMTPGTGVEPREPVPKELSRSIFFSFSFGKTFKYKSKGLL